MATYNGTNGDDIIVATAGSNQINAGAGNNRVTAVTTGSNSVNAGDGNDLITTGSGDDNINAGGGNNVIDAGNGNNTVNTNAGNDTITTGSGNDNINAGDGRNIIDAGGGNNNVNSGSGDDDIRTGAGNDNINAGNGNNLILAGEGQNNITSGTGDDVITTGSGNDTINAGDGRNTIDAGAGNNNITSGRGDDTITTGDGNDQISAGDGTNLIRAGGGNNQVNTGSGNDTITTGSGDDQVNAGDGTNWIDAGAGNNNVNTGRGDDTITTGSGNDNINAGDGLNIINAGGGNNNVNTGSGADQITTGDGNDNINAGEGANLINAGGGNNNINTGSGADRITSGSGHDNINAGEGNNVIDAGAGNNTITAGSGADQITTGSGNDAIYAGEGNNVIVAGDGINAIYAGSGNDVITSGSGADAIYAGEGNNIIDAGDGLNLIYTGSGNDRIITGDGTDLVYSGNGDDFVDLGGGSDVVYLDGGNDTIRHNMSENIGATDVYWGGSGVDTLQLVLTAAQAQNAAVIADIQRFNADPSGQSNGLFGWIFGFQFQSMNLTVRDFEKLEIIAPVDAVNDSAIVTEDASVNIAVLANDVDYLAANTSALHVISYDATGLQGTLTLNNNVFTFVPGAPYQNLAVGQTATVSFSYTMGDNQGFTDTATVTLTITGANDAPVAVADLAFGTENQALSINVLANDTDVDNGAVLTLLSAAAPAGKGTVSVVNNQIAFNPGTAFDHLAAGATEVVTLTYVIKDEKGATSNSTVTLTVTGTNDGPVAVADTAAGTENQTLTVNVLGNDTDLDDGHSYTLLSTSAPTGKGTTSIVGNQLVFNPGTAFDHLAVGATEVVTLSYTMKDDQGAQSSSTLTVTITGTNDAPIAVADTAAGTENQTLTINVLANDTDVDDGAVFTLQSVAAPVGKGTTSIVGNQLVFNPGAAFDHLAAGATEVVVLSYTMKDAQGAQSSSTVTVTITGTNDAPVAQASAFAATEDAAVITGSVTSTDIDDGATASYALNAPVAGLTLGTNGAYSFNPGNAAYQSLALGETLAVVANYTVTDDKGATSTSTLTITVTGTNDAPVAIAASTSATEDGALVTGSVTSTDVDHGATASYALNAPVAGLTLGTNGAYSFNPGNAAYQSLALGETVAVVANYTVTDDKGATSTSTLTITVTGTNDAPVAIAAVAAQTEDAAAITGTLLSTDVDHGATASFTLDAPVTGLTLAANGTYSFVATDPAYQALALGETLVVTAAYTVTDDHGATSQSTLTITVTGTNDAPVAIAAVAAQTEDAAAITGTLASTDVDHGATASFTLDAPVTGLTLATNGSYSFVATDPAYQALALGETLVVTAAYTVTDDHGATSQSNLTIIVTGTNDAPIAFDASFYAYEDAAPFSGIQGALDVDNGAVLSFALVAPVEGFTLNSDGTWSFVATAPEYQALAEGETLDVVAPYTVTDEHGASSTANFTITVTGTNDAPIAFDASFYAYEDAAPFSGIQGALDVDNGAVLSFALVAPVEGFTLNSDGTWSFVATAAEYQVLAEGETLDVVAPYTVIDEHGASSTATFVFTVIGTNDAPIVVDASAAQTEDAAAITGTLISTDVDHGATASFALDAPVEGLTLNSDGSYSFVATAAAYQALGLGETTDVVASYTVTDDQGATATAFLTITVTGTNDAPVAIVASSSAIEDGAVITGSVTSTDVDHGATASYALNVPVAGMTLGTNGAYSFNPGNAAYQSLALGETLNVVATYTVTDDHGATSQSTLTITVTGTNDAPVAIAASTSAIEDGATVTGTLSSTDVDHGATASYTLNAPVAGLTLGTNGAYSFNPGNAAYQSLALGETLAVVANYTVTDDKGASSVSTLTITVTGTNDAPVAIAAARTALEDGATLTGNLTSTDVDHGATASYTLNAPVAGLTLGTNGAYSFNPANTAYQALAAGEVQTIVANYTVTDDKGASSVSTLTLTVTGTNDAPVAIAATRNAIEDGATLTGNLTSTDVDHGATASYTLNAPVAGLTLNPNGFYTFDPSNPVYQSLAQGETVNVVANYTVTDDKGATSTSTLNILVAGTNDAPVVVSNAAAASGAVVEAGSSVSGTPIATGTLVSTDVDHGATATWTGSANGVYGSFAIDATGHWTYTLDNARPETDALAAGQVVTESFNTIVHDDKGATATQLITVTVTGSEDNRAPTVSDVTLAGGTGGSNSNGLVVPSYSVYYYENGVVWQNTVDANHDGAPDPAVPLDSHSAISVVTGDIDGDGDSDIVTTDGGTVQVFTNIGDVNGDGLDDFALTYQGYMPGQDVALTDLNGDGKLDIVTTQNAIIYQALYQGSGSGLIGNFLTTASYGGYSADGVGIDAGDLDGDGRADIAVANPYSAYYAIAIAYNRGDQGGGNIAYDTQLLSLNAIVKSSGVTIADINGDGLADIVVSGEAAYYGGASIEIMYNQGGGNFLSDGGHYFPENVYETTAIDIDGDGDLDLVSSGSYGNVTVSINQGDSNGDGINEFALTQQYTGYSTYGIAVTDIDGDGKLDIYAPNPYSIDHTAIYFRNIGDVNGDGIVDFETDVLVGGPSGWDAAPLNNGGSIAASGPREDGPAVIGHFAGADLDNGDTATLTYQILTQPVEGTVVNNGNGTFGFDPGTGFQDLAEGEARNVSFTYMATDTHGAQSGVATVTVVVQGTNDLPVITSSAAAAHGAVIEAGNLDNGTVVPGTAAASGVLTTYDADNGATATWSGSAAGAYGSFAISAAGAWTYTLNNSAGATQALREGTTATEAFTATVTDDKGATVTQVVTVTVAGTNDSPVVTSGQYAATEDGAIINGSVSVTDPDGLSRTFALNAPVAGFTLNSNGTFNFNPANAAYQSLAAGQTQVVVASITVTDDKGATALSTQTFTVTGTNDVPVLTIATPAFTFAENTVNAAPQLLSGITVNDADNNYGGGTVTIAGLLPEDRLSIVAGDGITVAGNVVSYNGTAIGTFSGGSGAAFNVVLNAAANNTSVNALLAHVGYADVSNTPTANRVLSYDVADGTGVHVVTGSAYTEAFGANNPLNGIGAVQRSTPTFADIDGDGKADLIVGSAAGNYNVYHNNGNGTFTQLTGAANPFNGFNGGSLSTSAFYDFDGDGKLDVILDSDNRPLRAFHNNGNGTFTELTGSANPFNGVAAGFDGAPAFIDVTGDGRADMVLGSYGGNLRVFQNNVNGTFTELTGSANPLAGVAVGSHSKPAGVDIDGDGDLDLVVGRLSDGLLTYRNNGNGTFTQLTGTANPFNGVTSGFISAPAFGDVDADGDLDLVVGADNGTLRVLKYAAPNGVAVTVTPQNDAPTAVADTAAVNEDATVSGSVATNDSDPESPANLTYALGAPVAGLTLGSNGTYSFNAANTAYQSLAAGQTQAVVANYTVTDAAGATATSTLTITVTGTNDAPVVTGAVTGTATEDGAAVTLNALTNASDVDSGTVLSITNIGTLPAGVTYDAVAKTFTLNPANAAYQSLAQGATQVVSVSYSVSDGTATVAHTANWTVTGINDGPVITSNIAAATGAVVEAGNLPNGTIVAGTPTATGTLTATDVDTGSTLSWSVNTTAGTFGTLAMNATGTWTYSLDNSRIVTQSIAAGQTVTETFFARVTDNNGAFVNQAIIVNVTGTNDKPILSVPMLDPAAVHPGDAFSYTVNSFIDFDGAITYTATLSDGSALPSWLTFNAATHAFSGTPGAGDAATLQVLVTATDASGATASDIVAFAVTPHFAGTSSNDSFTGTSANEVIVGAGGNDTLNGGAGNDIIYGGAYGESGPSPTAASTLTALTQSYYTHNSSLVNGLGTAVGAPANSTFGESVLAKEDDNFSAAIDITSVFGAAGLNFFGTNYTNLYVNNNGNLTFGAGNPSYTPGPIQGTGLAAPIIAAFWADVDTRGATSVSPGGASTGSDRVYYDLDTVNHVFTVTWDDVGVYPYNGGVVTPNAFQLQLIDRGSGNFDIIYRYEAVNWALGSASGGNYARVGFSSNSGTAYELTGSGTAAVLNYDITTGNTGLVGVQVFEVRNGVVSVSENDTLDGGAGADTLIGGSGNDTFIFRAGEANGDHVVDFNGADTSLGDSLQFVGYGAGATFTQIDTTHWQVNYGAGLANHDIITFDNAAPIIAADYTFI